MILGKIIIHKQLDISVTHTIITSPIQLMVIKEVRDMIRLKVSLRNLSNLTLR